MDPAVDADGDDDAVLIIDNCESWCFVYDSVNNTCVEDDTDTNIINPPVTEEPTIIVETCEGMGLVEENGTCVEPTIDPIEPTEETVSTFNCTSTYSFKLVANMVDGTTVESNPSPYLKPSNCE